MGPGPGGHAQQLVVVTCNTTAWGPATVLLSDTAQYKFDALLLQECKVSSSAAPDAEQWCRGQQLAGCINPCISRGASAKAG
eukprot:14928144-Alexandrium_andersonii.AAC.1